MKLAPTSAAHAKNILGDLEKTMAPRRAHDFELFLIMEMKSMEGESRIVSL